MTNTLKRLGLGLFLIWVFSLVGLGAGLSDPKGNDLILGDGIHQATQVSGPKISVHAGLEVPSHEFVEMEEEEELEDSEEVSVSLGQEPVWISFVFIEHSPSSKDVEGFLERVPLFLRNRIIRI